MKFVNWSQEELMKHCSNARKNSETLQSVEKKKKTSIGRGRKLGNSISCRKILQNTTDKREFLNKPVQKKNIF